MTRHPAPLEPGWPFAYRQGLPCECCGNDDYTITVRLCADCADRADPTNLTDSEGDPA